MGISVHTDTVEHGRPIKLCADVSILLVDDDPGSIQLMGRILAQVGVLRFATNGADALRLARHSAPDLILLDAEMPGMSGFELLKTLKSESFLADVPVIFITSHGEAGFEVSALDMGAADFITKPLRSSRVLARVRAQLRSKEMADELRRTATTDVLTGVANRRLFDQELAREWLRTQRADEPVSLLMIDVDNFKLYNDLYGHPQGDLCLQQVAAALVDTCRRPADLVSRYGGEEFVVLLPRTSRCGARIVAENVLSEVAGLGIFHGATGTIHRVSVSIGIACYDERSACWAPSVTRRRESAPAKRSTAGDLVLSADKALYAAKRAGRAQAILRDIADVETCEGAPPSALF